MKRAERLAWVAFGGLVGIAAVLLGAAFWYRFTGFWGGSLLCAGQAVVVGLAAWGMSLARQAAELREVPAGSGYGQAGPGMGVGGSGPERPAGGFRMSVGDDVTTVGGAGAEEAKVLDTGFQRLLVGVAGVVLMVMAGLLLWAVWYVYNWSRMYPDRPVAIVGILGGKFPYMDELCLLIGLGGAFAYGVLYWITRPGRDTEIYGEAVNSNFTLGLTGMAALGVGTVLGYFKVGMASETATAVMAAFMLLQGLELLANAFRSYSSIEELDQEAVDLQATPLGPMLASTWLGGLRLLFAESLGLGGGKPRHERGVVARLMPRALLALVVIAIGVSCIRVVQPGQVAILERLGYTPIDADGRPLPAAILHTGMHLTYPWPIDELVYIPTEQLQLVDVGTELHATGDWKNVDFQFWMIRPPSSDVSEAEDLFITGDPGSPQFLETYIQVRWRVSDPSRFYSALSHNEFFAKAATGADTRTLPIYEALIQQCTSFAVTRTFAIHTMEQILVTDRTEVEQHCRQILQDKLDALCQLPSDKPGDSHRGIEIVYLTIKDLHPPFWKPDRPDPSKTAIGGKIVIDDTGFSVVDDPERPSRIARGPASAFELVVSMREFKEQIINYAELQSIAMQNQAHGDAQSEIANAHAYSSQKVAQAHGEADRFLEISKNVPAEDLDLMKRRMLYNTAKELFDPVNKIIVDPEVSDVVIIQNTEKNSGGFRPPGP